MTFFDIRLPTDISYGAVGGPEFSTTLSTTKSGSEVKIKNWSQPRYKYNIMYGLKNRNQMQKLINFFNVCQGKSAHFRYKDWLDYIATDSFVANGDGVKTKFPLVKQYNFEKYTMARTINLPIISTIVVQINGNNYKDVTFNYNEEVLEFTSPPKSGDVISASFEFDVKARFDIDFLPISLIEANRYDVKDITIIEVK
jgi:uncharacterized protein (TIGR02217 family)